MPDKTDNGSAPRRWPRPELVLYGAFLGAILIVYAGSVIWSQRRLEQSYRRINAEIASRRAVQTAAVPQHWHYAGGRVSMRPETVPDVRAMQARAAAESGHDGGDVHEHPPDIRGGAAE